VSRRQISVFGRIREADIVHEPFPHAVVEDALDPALYRELEAAFPPLSAVAGDDELRNNYAYLLSYHEAVDDPTIDARWQEFLRYHVSAGFYRDFLALFGDDMRRLYPELEAFFGCRLEELPVTDRTHRWEAGDRPTVEMDVQFGINSPVERPTSVRGPHLDSRYKFFNALLYFRSEDDDSAGGEFVIYRFRDGKPRFAGKQPDPADLEPIKRVRYAPNTLVVFVNSPHAVHGVAPRSVTPHLRRYANFCAECYRLPDDQLFARPQRRGHKVRRALDYLARGNFSELGRAVARRMRTS